MSIRNFLQRVFRRRAINPKSEAMEILGGLGCFSNRVNRITPSMCNIGMINNVIQEMKRQGKTATARELENWLKINRNKL
jgi:hypothetical protein